MLAASLGAHRKAQHARVCFAGGRYFSRQRQLRECRCSARSAKRLAESTLGNCMLGVWLCPSRSSAPGGTRGGTGCKGAHHRSRYSPFRPWSQAKGRTTRPQSHHRRRHGRQQVSFRKPLLGRARGKESLTEDDIWWTGPFLQVGGVPGRGLVGSLAGRAGRHAKEGAGSRWHPPTLTQVNKALDKRSN